MIFSSSKLLRAFTNSDILFMDGTFKSCSPQFDQLYVIHGEVNIFSKKVRLPLIYVLMQDKKSEIYQAVFESISEKCDTVELIIRNADVT